MAKWSNVYPRTVLMMISTDKNCGENDSPIEIFFNCEFMSKGFFRFFFLSVFLTKNNSGTNIFSVKFCYSLFIYQDENEDENQRGHSISTYAGGWGVGVWKMRTNAYRGGGGVWP